ncbi:ADP-forming succinate--CoA ligase subunit beta [Candidatus Sumerlaeota bacterium]|nr:ADP-forming succinate--CoA ligase subunit beta [Candidatus Sumerlaeota bacterium]
MKIHEYQAKEIFRQYGIPTPKGAMVTNPDEAVKVAKELTFPVVIKAQVLVGGRGKAGGVKLANSPQETRELADAILGMDIKGIRVKKVLVEEAAKIKEELYMGIIIDRAEKLPVMMTSPAGGVDIEEIARTTPEKILKLHIKHHLGPYDFQVRQIGYFLGLDKAQMNQLGLFARGLYRLFIEKDASLAEINPLVITETGELIACDAKINFDDNALYRHPEVEALRDESEEDPLEAEARRKRINYVHLSGNIGCIVNGAGLAMATMDLIKHFGGAPANFLDIGGGARSEQVTEALRLITADKNVRAILINIFGGIVRCDRVAQGILDAFKQLDFKLPIVIRLTGTNEEEAHKMLEGTELIPMPTMSDAARKVVELVK